MKLSGIQLISEMNSKYLAPNNEKDFKGSNSISKQKDDIEDRNLLHVFGK